MFDQMKALKQIAGLMGNAGELKQKFEAMQAELAQKTVAADAGAGAVRVTVNGQFRVVSVMLDPTLVVALVGGGEGGAQDADREMVEELIASATNAALASAQEMVKDQMASLTGGLNLPGMDQLMGG